MKNYQKPARYATDGDSGLIAYALVVAQETLEGVEPSTYSEAISCPNFLNQLTVTQEEMENLHKNGT